MPPPRAASSTLLPTSTPHLRRSPLSWQHVHESDKFLDRPAVRPAARTRFASRPSLVAHFFRIAFASMGPQARLFLLSCSIDLEATPTPLALLDLGPARHFSETHQLLGPAHEVCSRARIARGHPPLRYYLAPPHRQTYGTIEFSSGVRCPMRFGISVIV